jgi:Bacterial Ig-like domain
MTSTCRLITGGLGANRRPLATVELFDPSTGAFRSERARLNTARAHHSATLLPTGEVLVWGGVDASGIVLDAGEVIDLRTGVARQVRSPLAGLGRDRVAPALVASIPADGAQGVSTSTLVIVRFGEPLAVASVTPRSVTLDGPTGPVVIAVVPAENGLLAFVTPQTALSPGTTYSLHLDGLVDTAGLSLPSTVIRFTTQRGSSTTPGGSGSSGGTGDGAVPPGEDDSASRVTLGQASPFHAGKTCHRWRRPEA